MSNLNSIKARDLIQQALTEPGQCLAAYRAFHRFSAYNMRLAQWQLYTRGIEITPIKTFKQWREYGRTVKKGEKAIALLMPMIMDIKEIDEKSNEVKITGQRQVFVAKNYWFALAQTEEYRTDKKNTNKKLEDDVGNWCVKTALKNLKIKQIAFSHVNGNAQGYATKNGIAINPLAAYPVKTAIHEIAHTVLGHLNKKFGDSAIEEVEAEITTYLVISSIGYKGLNESRQYIQHWLGERDFPEESAQKCITAANKILDAGKIEKQKVNKNKKKAQNSRKAA